jgi:RNA polymerase sigma-70 factor (ECF subfamily)
MEKALNVFDYCTDDFVTYIVVTAWQNDCMPKEQSFEDFFKEVYKKHFTMIFRVAFRITGESFKAEDVCHEAFLKFYEKGRAITDSDQAKYWLIRVVKNLAYNTEKRKQIEAKAINKLKPAAAEPSPSSEEQFFKTQTESAVQEALNKLPYNLRIVLILKEFEGLTYKEIASIIGISEANVKVRVFRGREKLEKIIRENQGEE